MPPPFAVCSHAAVYQLAAPAGCIPPLSSSAALGHYRLGRRRATLAHSTTATLALLPAWPPLPTRLPPASAYCTVAATVTAWLPLPLRAIWLPLPLTAAVAAWFAIPLHTAVYTCITPILTSPSTAYSSATGQPLRPALTPAACTGLPFRSRHDADRLHPPVPQPSLWAVAGVHSQGGVQPARLAPPPTP